MLDLYLIRHAESEMNIKPHLIGGRSLDAKLSERGVAQCERLHERFVDEGLTFDDVLVAPSLRATRTAYLSCGDRFPQWKMEGSASLHELSQGDWEGRSRREIYTKEMLARINGDNLGFRPPRGESQRDVEDRMSAVAKSYTEKYTDRDGTVAFFGHGMAFKCLFRKIMDSDPKLTYRIVLDNTSITRFRHSPQGWHLVCLNDTSHLRGMQHAPDLYL